MRLIYLDEAGISNIKQEPFVTMAGIIVHGDSQLRDVEHRLKKLVKKHIPEELQEDFVFHAKEIFHGGNTLNRKDWPLRRRLKIADDLAKIPRDFDVKVVFGWHKRDEFSLQDWAKSLSDKERTKASLAVAYLDCLVQVESWMRENCNNENCLMIVEDNSEMRSTLKEVQVHNQNTSWLDESWADEVDAKIHSLFPLKYIREDPLFQSKRSASVLEIADFCAYIWKRLLVNENDEKYHRYLTPLRSQIVIVGKPEE